MLIKLLINICRKHLLVHRESGFKVNKIHVPDRRTTGIDESEKQRISYIRPFETLSTIQALVKKYVLRKVLHRFNAYIFIHTIIPPLLGAPLQICYLNREPNWF